MRDAATRFQCKRLFVLGAGASFAASGSGTHKAPLDKDFTRTISKLDYEIPQWIETSKQSVMRAYKGPDLFQSTGLEEVVIRQLGHLEFLSRIHPRRAKNLQSSNDFLSHLNRLICVTLSRCQQSREGYYSRLAKIICNGKNPETCNDRIISFNYDTLLDKEMYTYFDWPGLYFDDFRESRTAKAWAKTSCPMLVKLHGSINWRCESKELQNALNHSKDSPEPYSIPLIWHDSNRPDPNADYAPLIVPPLPSKPITSIRLLRYLWTKAYEYLHEAEEIYIVGYSLPPTDSMAVSMFSNFTNKKLKSVFVADPNGLMMNKWRSILNRSGLNIQEWRYAEDFGEIINYLEQ